ncbi:hypothetical protein Pmani_020655 [Petrolisthes manimaculis]|uniref:Galectin domain-containing protein n=1 Tax=Petrolisthes manimaculis TaxID=1843537 RepID=A0AAE1PHW5_9EUCA|nr:hypothetical protein Pmani_020655 [Petrolisthes manimaculis]
MNKTTPARIPVHSSPLQSPTELGKCHNKNIISLTRGMGRRRGNKKKLTTSKSPAPPQPQPPPTTTQDKGDGVDVGDGVGGGGGGGGLSRRNSKTSVKSEFPGMWTDDGKYLTQALGDALIKGLSEVNEIRPNDPVSYLASCLYSYRYLDPSPSTAKDAKRVGEVDLSSGGSDRSSQSTIAMQTAVDSTGGTEPIPSPQNRDRDGRSILHFAACHPHPDPALQLLIAASGCSLADRDHQFRTPRDLALEYGLTDNVAAIDQHVLGLAERGDVVQLSQLLIDGYDLLEVEDSDGASILQVAERSDNPKAIQFLTDASNFEDKRDWLHKAVKVGSLPHVQYIADTEELAVAKDDHGRTSLHLATLCEDKDIMEFLATQYPSLLSIGDNVGRTPLHYAMAVEGVDQVAKVLVQAGAKRAVKDLRGMTVSSCFIHPSAVRRLQQQLQERLPSPLTPLPHMPPSLTHPPPLSAQSKTHLRSPTSLCDPPPSVTRRSPSLPSCEQLMSASSISVVVPSSAPPVSSLLPLPVPSSATTATAAVPTSSTSSPRPPDQSLPPSAPSPPTTATPPPSSPPTSPPLSSTPTLTPPAATPPSATPPPSSPSPTSPSTAVPLPVTTPPPSSPPPFSQSEEADCWTRTRMPSSQVFAVSNLGRVFSLATDQATWRELHYLGLEFKRVSAHETVLWALGGDHQVYVYVYGSSVPIRVCEEAYENQRWNPLDGFTDQLLPSDRAMFSSEDGLKSRSLSSVTLPTLAWSWESPWHIHHTHQGQALDKEGWTYAVDFPRSYTAEKRWNSCVRRRKWVRYRSYVALDTWSAVPTIYSDATEEPFIDICVGGGEVPGDDPDNLMVWGITALGRVMVREGVSGQCPEGCRWIHVATPADRDVTSVSVGRSGRVWAVTWDGGALIRTGVSRDHPTGSGWISVAAPQDSRLQHVGVGLRALWAVTRDNRVWFRRGLGGSGSGQDNLHDKDTGTAWLLMVGSLLLVTLGPNDQVLGVTAEDHSIVIRTGITETELTGKTWKPICLPLGCHSPSPTPSPSPSSSLSPSPSPKSKTNHLSDATDNTIRPQIGATNFVVQNKESVSLPGFNRDDEDNRRVEKELGCMSMRESGSEERSSSTEKQKMEKESPLSDSLGVKIQYPEDCPSSLSSSEISEACTFEQSGEGKVHSAPGVKEESKNSSVLMSEVEAEDHQKPDKVDPFDPSPTTDQRLKQVPKSLMTQSSLEWSESRLRHISNSSGGSEAGQSHGMSMVVPPREDDGPAFPVLPLPADHLWLWVTGGGCWIQASNMPKWFSSEGSPVVSHEPWRQGVLLQLKQRHLAEIIPFAGYEEAVEGSSWVTSGQCRWWAGGQWVPATLELVLTGSRRTHVQDATLIARYALGSPQVEEMSCGNILLVVVCVEVGRSLLALYHPDQPLSPTTLTFSQETDAEEWLGHISSACNQYRGVTARACQYTMWGVTTQGDIYLHDASSTEQELRVESVSAHKQLSLGSGTTPIVRKLDRGFRPGCFFSAIITILPSAQQFHINLQTSQGANSNIALHINPRFTKKCMILNSKKKSMWGSEKHINLGSLCPGNQFEISIVCDDHDFKISLDDKYWCNFRHRLAPSEISHVAIRGDINLVALTYNHGAGEKQLCEWYWRGIGGHMKQVEGGACGIVWAISHDLHVYTYTGAAGGGLYKGSNGCEGSDGSGVILQSDTRHMYVWENQRWNPVTGFTYRGLPTDRYTWSDVTGRYQRTRESIKLPSRHWTWTSEWCIDHHTPGGVDREGWQYATDFPLSYHAHRYVTDLVRRRRWVRKCRIITSGPWRQLEKVALLHISVSPEVAEDKTIPVWGVSATGEVVVREGVCGEGGGAGQGGPVGERWCLVPAECPMSCICGGIGASSVWAVSRDGRAHLRLGVTSTNPKGTHWVNVDSPGEPLVEVCAGAGMVWGLDKAGQVHRRLQVHPLFPEGTDWQLAASDIIGISVSCDGTLWAILGSYSIPDGGRRVAQGVMARRVGVSDDCPIGSGWDHTLGTGWSAISTRLPLPS